MGFTAIAMLLCEYAGLVAPRRQKGAANAKRMLLTNLLVAVLCLGGVTAHVTLIDYYQHPRHHRLHLAPRRELLARGLPARFH